LSVSVDIRVIIDVSYTSKFEDYFGYTEKIELDKTFRFNNKINSFATTFITENPAQIKKNITSHTNIDSNAITLVQYYRDVDKAIQECVEDIWSNGSGAFQKSRNPMNHATGQDDKAIIRELENELKNRETQFYRL
jgi:hypothetical protein